MNFNLKLKRYCAGEGPRYIARPRVVLQVAAAHGHTSLIPVLLFIFFFFRRVLLLLLLYEAGSLVHTPPSFSSTVPSF